MLNDEQGVWEIVKEIFPICWNGDGYNLRCESGMLL